MKLPISWLKDWVEADASPETIADLLTRLGFYVEGIETLGSDHPGVVVARVLEVGKHPNADRLSLCRVDSGSGELSVVCGAPNVRAGMIVPLATIGTTLKDGRAIGKSKIRGVESSGMLCSARELQISEDHEGILDLGRMVGESAEGLVGRPLAEALGPRETVLEVEVPFNRGDGLGIVGLAREVMAGASGRWTAQARERFAGRWKGNGAFDLELEDQEGCPSYLAQAIEGVAIGPSPEWLKRRVESVGQRSINGVVDLTNWVLFELGQPLHVFDLDRLEGPAIRVRRARAGERITTLDGKDRALDPEVLVIADRMAPVAIAGVMGGAESEVRESSTRLLLECAWFDPRRVRRGAKILGLATEASRRYERGVDRAIGGVAAARFLELLREVSPGMRLGAATERSVPGSQSHRIVLRTERLSRLIGLPVSAAAASERLEAFEFGVERGEPLAVTVPSWRPDVTLEDDLVEEVARGIGYDKIPDVPLETGGAHGVRSERERLVERSRRAMLSRGLSEALCTTLISVREAEEAATLLGHETARLIRLTNPMSRESEVLRPNPIPGLLRACALNLRQGSPSVRLFEIGAGFLARNSRNPKAGNETAGPRGVLDGGSDEIPEETLMLAALVAGQSMAHAHDANQRSVDFDDAKGLWEAWIEEMVVDTPEWRAYSAPGWKPGASAEVASRTSRIGWAGTLGPSLLRGWDIEIPVHVFVVLLGSLEGGMKTQRASLPGRFPPVRRDLAFFVPESLTHRGLEGVLAGSAGEWLRSIELFDVYAGPGTPGGMKSMAYALQFQHPERTLTEVEIQAIQDRMAAAVAKECGGRLREK